MRTPSFGKRHEAATITIVKNGRSHHFAFHPLTVSVVFSLVAMFMVGYLVATAYLVFRDDLIGAARARNARLMHEYEDRIATLRANLDRVTSRQLLDQQMIEARIAELLKREETLRNRSSHIGQVLDAARRSGLIRRGDATSPSQTAAPDPVQSGSLAPAAPANIRVAIAEKGIALRGTHDGGQARMPRTVAAIADADAGNVAQTRVMFETVAGRIEEIDARQRATLDAIRIAADDRTTRIAGIMSRLDITVPGAVEDQVGGPFVPVDPRATFNEHLQAVDESLKNLDQVTGKLESVPLANPVPGASISSRFGNRIDPFVRQPAMHSGIDFRAGRGTPVHATADGVVIDAGRNGGYGNMVEIEHAAGLNTRYGHLSKILVKTGDRVEIGTVIGEAGSTGRSTGPHLHYEIRKSGNAINPIRYLRAGRELAKLL